MKQVNDLEGHSGSSELLHFNKFLLLVGSNDDLYHLKDTAACRSGNGIGRINEVTLRRARLVLGWVICPGSTPGGGTLFRYVTSQPGRLSLSSFQGR